MNYTVDYGNPVTEAEIISLERCKENSNVFHDLDDALYEVFRSSISDEIEAYLGYPVLERSALKIKTEWFGSFNLPVKINEISSITYIDGAGASQTIGAADYEVFDGLVTMNIEKPSGFVKYITITCTAGYATANMPSFIKNAALLMFSARETYREDRKDINDTVAKSVLRPHRLY